MLRLSSTNTFAAAVAVKLPSNDPSKDIDGEFTARFKFLKTSEFNERQRELAAVMQNLMRTQLGNAPAPEGEDAPSWADLTEFRRKLLEDVLVGVEGIADEGGEPYPADVQRAAVLENLPLLNATAQAFFDAYAKAPEKNSKPSRGR